MILEPGPDGHRLTVDQGGVCRSAPMDSDVAAAAIVRLCVLARLDLRASADPLGRLRVCSAGVESEVLVEVHADQRGLGAALRRIATAGEDGAAALPGGALDRVGSYRVEAELGRGAMGVVYRGVHEVLEKPVAIKVISDTLSHRPETAERFLREARAASRVRHRGIVDVTDFGALPDGRPFLVMELVEWPTLLSVLKKEGPFRPARAATLAALVADALDAVHARGVIHRDLKPSNLFLGPDDHIKIADFGTAKVTVTDGKPERLTQTGVIMGTPFYMSPEQARGHATDARTDLYALGCILFRMITGKVPFSRGSAMDVLMSHINEPPPPMVSPFGPLPPGLVAVVDRALAKDVSDRYPHAGEMLADLRRAVPERGERQP